MSLLQTLMDKLRLRRNSRGSELTAEQKQDLKRQAIRCINAQTDLSPQEKQQRIQAVLLEDYTQAQAARAPEPEAAAVSYQDENKTVLGCKHYLRGCQIKAPCCGKMFVCRLCHDEKTDHAVDRKKIAEMRCMYCNTLQPCAQDCANQQCGKRMSKYYCDICHLFDDHPDRDIYHCPHCGICRRGKGLGIDFFHCMKCNVCLSINQADTHTCIERLLESNCPICHQYMFTSVAPVIFLQCRHPMHQRCYDKFLESGNYACPLCSKSILPRAVMDTLFEQMEAQVLAQPMPPAYQHWKATVLCNDCVETSIVPFHFLYQKCARCGSYNTKTVNTDKASSPPDHSESAVAAPARAGLAPPPSPGPAAPHSPAPAPNSPAPPSSPPHHPGPSSNR